jgi:acetyltransferase-like isoleucine patch superfamily enzyme
MIIRLKCHCDIDNVTGNGEIVRRGHAIIDKSDASKIILKDNLILGENLRKGSSVETYLKMHENSILEVNGKFKVFYGASVELFKGAELKLGRGYINTGGAIACAKSITIGNGVFIGRNTYITDSDHHIILDKNGNILNEPREVVIQNHVLVGFGAVILKGVTVGEGAVIGAGSVVTKDIPAGCLAAGTPAKVIKDGIEWR